MQIRREQLSAACPVIHLKREPNTFSLQTWATLITDAFPSFWISSRKNENSFDCAGALQRSPASQTSGMSDWWICIFKLSNFARILSCRNSEGCDCLQTVFPVCAALRHLPWSRFYEYTNVNNLNKVMQTFSPLMKHPVCDCNHIPFKVFKFLRSFLRRQTVFESTSEWESKLPELTFDFCIRDFF